MTSETVLPGPHSQAERGHTAPRAGRVLLLAPSQGRGGGIERYVQTIQSAFDIAGVSTHRVNLSRPGPGGHRALYTEASAALAGVTDPTRVVASHRALLPVATALNRAPQVSGISVICHGRDVWGTRGVARRTVEGWLMRRPDVRLVAVSGFTAGVLLPRGQAAILPPGLSADWFSELVEAASQTAAVPAAQDGLEVMTAFRLAEWRDKGLPELTAAIAALGRPDVRLAVCGSGQPSTDLLAHVRHYPWCTLLPGLTDSELAGQFARSDLFVLATRTRHGRRPFGEGFGLVLLEAQVAGTAVIGPAHGGSTDAYLDGVTGAAPRDESRTALTQVLGGLTRDRARLAEMGALGASWARARFAPSRYAALAVDRLL